ncbi:poly-gamma-glutamate biosynthesis protein PgsC/CapC [Cyanobium sp. BA20m-p-22]|uniref:poly-gamma-glutamate biosynthesis protein PgsC/CapC n=1 Tax=Cyanobium sp. BA20m-p-22 TaxID=2823704 RepID=UPI0020CB89F5|nr:poly-gamma-glutamate biosynthesis protein PgsC/CapC [Cyanobium sp. BA20m-p-22]
MILNTPEIERFSLAIGALIAMAWKDRRGVIPGGVVVPGFLLNALLLSPPWGLAILLISGITQAIYQRWLERAEYQRREPMYILGTLSLLLSTPVAWLLIQAGLLPA